jgi:hypothetical protein
MGHWSQRLPKKTVSMLVFLCHLRGDRFGFTRDMFSYSGYHVGRRHAEWQLNHDNLDSMGSNREDV